MPPPLPLGLSKRQYECLTLASEHRTSKEIAALLGISHHTVDGHIEAAVTALGLADRATAARQLIGYHKAAQVHAAAEATSEGFTGDAPPVEFVAMPKAFDEQSEAESPARQRRRISLNVWWRLSIVFGLAAASIYAAILLVVGADVIARRVDGPAVARTPSQ